MDDEFCRKLGILRDLVTGDFSYHYYGEECAKYTLSILNSVVKKNVGLFCFDNSILNNYRKMVEQLNKNYFGKDVLIGYTYAFEIEKILSDDNKCRKYKDDFINNYLEMHNIYDVKDVSFVKKMIVFDSAIISSLWYKEKIVDDNDDFELLRGTLKYFLNLGGINYNTYNSFVKYYKDYNDKRNVDLNMEDISYLRAKLTYNSSFSKDLLGKGFYVEKRKFLQNLNYFVNENIGLFCLYDDALNNYKNILDWYYYDNNTFYVKEIIKGLMKISDIENMDLSIKKQYALDYLLNEKKKRDLDNIPSREELLVMMRYDFAIYNDMAKRKIFYDGEKPEKYIRSSLNYFMSTDKQNMKLYNSYIKLYNSCGYVCEKEKDIVLHFYRKKQGILKRLLKK